MSGQKIFPGPGNIPELFHLSHDRDGLQIPQHPSVAPGGDPLAVVLQYTKVSVPYVSHFCHNSQILVEVPPAEKIIGKCAGILPISNADD